MIHRVLCEDILHMPPEELRVVTKDVGGSFGMKIFPYPEYALVLYAARKLGQAVRWTATRTESFYRTAMAGHGWITREWVSMKMDELRLINATRLQI